MLKKTVFAIIITLASFAIATAATDQDLKQQIREYYLRGNIYYQQGRYKEAKEAYRQAIELSNCYNLTDIKIPEEKEKQISPAPKSTQPVTSKSNDYIIGTDDILHITVWQNQDLSQDAIVRPDGKISFPLIGDIQASGLTIVELDNEITNRLKEYVKYPEVSISIVKIGGERVIILGQVMSPGIYSVIGRKTIMEAIGQAGGFTRDSVPSSTVLIRGGLNTPSIKRLNLAKIFKGDLSNNIILQSQDIIFVPRKFITNLNYFLNQVLDPLRTGSALKTGFNANMTW